LLLQLTTNDLQSQFDQVVVLSYSHQYPWSPNERTCKFWNLRLECNTL